MKQFVIPELGENIHSATIVKVLIKPGDIVEIEQSVLEVETDKATIEVPSDVSGKVVEVKVKDGDQVEIGQAIFSVEDAGGASVASEAPKAEEPKVEEKTIVEEKQPTPQEQAVQAEKPAEPEAKALEQPTVALSGNLPSDSPKIIKIENQPPLSAQAAPAAPSVRRLAREIGVDVNEIKGTGPGGRISLDDVKFHSKRLHQQRNEIQHIRAEQHQEPLPDFSKYGDVETVAMSNIRYKTAEHLSYAWHTIPHVTQFDKADITQLEEFRKGYAKAAEKFGVKLTVTAILVKVIASAMKTFPQFNASVDMQNKSIVYKKYFNIGIAVDTEHGLIVPVVKNADTMNIIEITKEINVLAEKARNKKIGVADMQGGCFTISNLGGIGGTSFTPIVNSPEVAILGVSKGSIEPVYIDGKFEPRLMLPLSLSYDHRLIDGADAIRFLRWVIEALENPLKLIIEG
ncbi:MAG: branched-chain alpha-keto acid dehydrogenase subunit E2 [Bacteroidales bacterium 36-12]|nr:MAG: branched-chain alpha-keto acid dehydrogenase subunit E2 [Bacteroidales bacterium 36-12]